ncbi:hypothetical protein [Clostridium cadaveris]|uniref:hypothetical protein n=1 Tax=Clostridium cadaveris TaxID=1529 RepID=UPI000C07C970|nr:hypothetical protein [Clostridium cadaveris]
MDNIKDLIIKLIGVLLGGCSGFLAIKVLFFNKSGKDKNNIKELNQEAKSEKGSIYQSGRDTNVNR